MGNSRGTYTPDNETLELLSRLEQGTIDKTGMEHLRMLFSTDPDFAAFFTSWRNAIAGKKQAQQAQQAGGNQRRATTGIDQYLNSKNSSSGYSSSSRTVSPGGFKASGRDSDSMARRSGRINSEEFIDANVSIERVKDEKGNDTDAIKSVSYGSGRKKRKYDDAKIQWILERGSSGATLGKEDQAVYDAVMQDTYRINAEKKQRKAEQREFEALARANAEKARQKEMEEQRKRDMETFKTNEAIRQARALEEYKAQAKREEQKRVNDAFNKRYGVDPDVELDDEEKKLLMIGKKKWDYNESDRKDVERMYEEMAELERDNDFTDEDKALMMEMYDEALNGYRKRLVDSKDPRTLEQMKAEADANGGVYLDDKGNVQAWPETAGDKRMAEQENKKLERMAAREVALGKFIDAKMTADQEAHEKAQDEAALNWDSKKGPFQRAKFDAAQSAQNALERYNIIDNTINPPAEEEMLEEGEEGEIPLDERQPLGPDGYVPEQSPVAETPTANGRSWTGSQRFAETMAQQSGEAPMEFEICPVCEAELMPDGICPVCGFSDENAVMAWEEQRNVQG